MMKNGKIPYYINGKDEQYGNWMGYIKKKKNTLYLLFNIIPKFTTEFYKDVKPDDECLVWYGEEYAKDLGIDFRGKWRGKIS